LLAALWPRGRAAARGKIRRGVAASLGRESRSWKVGVVADRLKQIGSGVGLEDERKWE
jgi:hypothetical protein